MPPAWLEANSTTPVAHAHLVGIRLARQRGGGEALADLDALHRVDRHQRRGDLGVQLAVDRRAQAGGHAFRHHLDHRAGRGTRLAHLGQVALPTASQWPGRGRRTGCRPPRPSPSAPGRCDAGRSAPARRGCAPPRPAPCAPRRRRRPASRSRAPTTGRRRDSRGCRISARRSGRRGRAGTAPRSPSSRASAGRRCRSACAIGVPVVRPSNTPDRMRTSSGSCRCVVKRDWPGRRRSSQGWMSASDSAMRGGQPSTTQPIAGPWLSPQVVTRNRWPKLLWDMASVLRTYVLRSRSA